MSGTYKPPQVILREDGILEIIDERFRPLTAEEKAERKSFGAQLGHIKRRLNKNEPLTGKTLELALSIVGEPDGDSEQAKFCRGIVHKLKAGKPLSEYEHHMMVDVWLLHARF